MFKFFNLGVRKKGVVTTTYPEGQTEVPEGTIGAPELMTDRCTLCRHCDEVCPTGAIRTAPSRLSIDLGLCIFCGECARACPKGAIVMSRKYELSSRDRASLEVEYHVDQ
jgi:formate hydrogenlyase subunit 6/NADH:ubiquinone oxidoreductase subunit I